MSVDVKIFTICDHFSGNKQYILDKCPKCWGRGYYYDISYNSAGKAILISGTLKLQQEMLKIINDVKGENIFFKNWGCECHDLIGSKKLDNITNARIQMMIRMSLEYLRALQIDQQSQFHNLTSDEILQGIQSISLQDYIIGVDVSVTITNVSNEILNQTVLL